MNDRELLEKAARAAGLNVLSWLQDGYPFVEDASGQKYGWNPLVFDSDALRLAVKLGLAVSVEYQVGSTAVLWGPPMGNVRDSHNDDPYAATRRAIVRAAAAMDKGE